MKRTAAMCPTASTKPKPVIFVSASAVDVAQPSWLGTSTLTPAHRIFTAFHFINLVAICLGLALGAAGGAKLFGSTGGLIGALIGGYAGFILGGLPEWLVFRSLALALARESADELRSFLRSPNCQIPNLVLMELASRGEDITGELNVVLDLLESEDVAQRGRGWAAMISAFPEVAAKVRNYRIGGSVAECREQIAPLRNVP
jgi:hypothetical protein